MAITIKHKFQSLKSDGVDSTFIQPSNWNDTLDFKMATSKLLGRSTAGAGDVEEITPSGNFSLATGGLELGSAVAFPGTGAVKVTIGTTAQRPGVPAVGMIRYNTDLNAVEIYAGAAPAWAQPTLGGVLKAGDTMTGPLITRGLTLSDTSDNTKQLVFALVGISTGTVRTATPPDANFKIAALDVADQVVTGGASVTSLSLGTISAGTVTPDPGDRPMQHYTNNGAHTLAPGAVAGSYLLDITNGASAGIITTTGWTKVTGDSFATTNGLKYRCSCSIGNAGSLLVVQALQ